MLSSHIFQVDFVDPGHGFIDVKDAALIIFDQIDRRDVVHEGPVALLTGLKLSCLNRKSPVQKGCQHGESENHESNNNNSRNAERSNSNGTRQAPVTQWMRSKTGGSYAGLMHDRHGRP